MLYEIEGGETQRASLVISFKTAACLYYSRETEKLTTEAVKVSNEKISEHLTASNHTINAV